MIAEPLHDAPSVVMRWPNELVGRSERGGLVARGVLTRRDGRSELGPSCKLFEGTIKVHTRCFPSLLTRICTARLSLTVSQGDSKLANPSQDVPQEK